MSRKWKLAIAILAVFFGVLGIYVVIGGFLIRYGAEYAVGALIPFIMCLAVVVYQRGELHAMRRLAEFCLAICFVTMILSMTGLGIIYAPDIAHPGSLASLVATVFLLNFLVVLVGGVVFLIEILEE